MCTSRGSGGAKRACEDYIEETEIISVNNYGEVVLRILHWGTFTWKVKVCPLDEGERETYVR